MHSLEKPELSHLRRVHNMLWCVDQATAGSLEMPTTWCKIFCAGGVPLVHVGIDTA